MKIILPWLLVVIAAVGAVFLYNDNQSKTAELTKLQAQVQELETGRAEVEELKKNQIAPEELARMQEAKDELLKLRNEVRQLRTDKVQLNQQAQAAKTAAANAQAQIVAAQVRAEEVAAIAAKERTAALPAARPIAADPAGINACLNNLRQINAAKHQWGIEHQKTAETIPLENDLVAYFAGQAVPVCPGGGKYTFGPLSTLPACSVPGHNPQ